MKFKEALSKFWFLIWKDDSLKGWVLSLIFIFVFIKFIFFPILSFTLGTSLPLAIVESCSMYHSNDVLGNFDIWWNSHEEKYSQFEISKTTFETFSMYKGFNKGDIIFITGTNPNKIKIGDIIIYNTDTPSPVIHRVMNITETSSGLIFQTIGDNNNGQIYFEKQVTSSQIVGKAQFKLAPLAGWFKLIFYENGRSSSERGFCHEN